ncbi:1-deoxy-D-xylulose-5-phosphate reductoisomerase [Pseudoclavibacter sp. CFCC 13796]|uniref:1-deoxy-D-xylulose-5-phosphate reductoisomerase n=1 Tax=Pseudoclavibacter sp. CFCC 13796 TaxID=2615179 RepID=UPI001300FB01|nr:1-deoxy-D-xylulose-5-phosphate reductoisomerase [Pseudoclavibacter sp. CFCC 13796]KAB1661196.1 1-deoxy-D-xylulose-5-phosphate reductoisomerase [Pseudoclavibacter sp. CFCC 13796]
MSRRVIILGATGSIGRQASELIAATDRFEVVGLAAGHDTTALRDLARRHGCRDLAVAEPSVDEREAGRVDPSVTIRHGADAAVRLVREVTADVVLNAIDGAAGLAATLAVLRCGATLALANKESLVIGGDLVAAAAAPGQIVPVDSEHSAIAQCLRAGSRREVSRLVLTASGGPFRGRSRAELEDVTPQQALRHPTWNMGSLVTVNSATMVNKGLEIIEAHYLFDMPYERIDAVVHPQSIVHSMVQFVDGATVAQLSPPDMRLPISMALDWPHRLADAVPAVDWSQVQQWSFEPIDHDAFPAVRVAKQVGERAGTWPAVFNAANEVMVAEFLAGRIGFATIVDGISRVLEQWRQPDAELTVEAVLAADRWARRAAHAVAAGVGAPTFGEV